MLQLIIIIIIIIIMIVIIVITGPYLGFFVSGGKLHKPSQGSPVYRQGF